MRYESARTNSRIYIATTVALIQRHLLAYTLLSMDAIQYSRLTASCRSQTTDRVNRSGKERAEEIVRLHVVSNFIGKVVTNQSFQ